MIANNDSKSNGLVIDPINQSKPGSGVEETSTTTIVNDGHSSVVAMTNPVSLSDVLKNAASTGIEQSIKDYFRKPIRIANGNFQSTDSGTNYLTNGLFQLIRGDPVYSNKWDGYFGIRCDFVVRLQVNATRFQQGRYILGFVPYGGAYLSQSRASKHRVMHACTTQTCLQNMHVEVDLNTDTEVILRIPYINHYVAEPVAAISLNTYLGEVGAIYLRPYVPFASAAGSTVAPYTVWVNLENVELFGASYTQSGRVKTFTRKKKFVADIEQDQMNIGPFTQGFTGLSMLAGSIGKIPLLSSFAAPVRWASNLAAGVCSTFGWCKPTNLKPAKCTRRVIFPNFANTDGSDCSNILALTQTNEVGVTPGFSANDQDELSINFLTSIPTLYGIATWATTDAVDTTIYTVDLKPNVGQIAWNDNGKTLTQHSPLSFLSTYFRYYRGSLAVKVKLVKTEFHSGRLMVAYFPKPLGITNVKSLDHSNFVHRAMIDIRETSEFDMVIPWVSEIPYKDVDTPYGYLSFFVIDPLVAPDTVVSSIKIIVEIYGTQDLEFAVPQRTYLVPTYPTSTQSEVITTFTQSNEVATFSASSSSKLDGNSGDPTNIGNVQIAPIGLKDENSSSEACIGEKILSLRSLLKRPQMYDLIDISAGALPVTRVDLMPMQLNAADCVAGTWYYPSTNKISDLIDVLGLAFTFMRGSIRVKYVAFDTSSGLIASAMIPVNFQPGFSNFADHQVKTMIEPVCSISTFAVDNQQTLMAFNRCDLTGGIEVQSPQYLTTHSRCSAAISCQNDAVNPSASTVTGSPNYLLQFGIIGAARGVFYRSAGEDFNLGCFISLPVTST